MTTEDINEQLSGCNSVKFYNVGDTSLLTGEATFV